MSINTLDFITFRAKPAWSQSGNIFQSLQLVFVRPVCVIMSAVSAIRAILAKEMYVAHVQIFDSFHIALIKLDCRINPLPVAIARDYHGSIRVGLWRRRRRRQA